MPRTCTVCNHPKRTQIDKAILAGASVRDIAKHNDTTPAAVQRHKPHVSAVLMKAAEAEEALYGDDLVAKLRQLSKVALQILAEARGARQYSAAMAGVREMGRIVELVARLTGQLDESARIAVVVQGQQEREASATADLQRLDVAERLELARLLAKAKGFDEPAVETTYTPETPAIPVGTISHDAT